MDASERCSVFVWVDVSAVLLRRSDCCHVLWAFVVWRCRVRRDRQAGLRVVLWEEVSSAVWQ